MKKRTPPESVTPQPVAKEQTAPKQREDLLARLAKHLEGLPILEDSLLQQKQDRFDEMNR